MNSLHIRTKLAKHFLGSELSDLFNDMCDLMEGVFDPWEKVNALKLRFYDFDEEEVDFDNWLINAGQFILAVKAHVMLHKKASPEDVSRLCKWFQDTLDSIKNDFLPEEKQYYYSFSILAEFIKFYVKKDVTGLHTGDIDGYMEVKLHEVGIEPPNTKHETIALVVPYILDAIKIHKDASTILLHVLDQWIGALSSDKARLDDVLGLCIRTLAFQDYATASPDDMFKWALARAGRITDIFTDLTSSIHLAIGHALRGEKEKADAMLASALAKAEPLATPKKEVHLGFLMRGCIEAGIVSGNTFEAIAKAVQELIDTTIDRIQALNAELGELKDKDEQDPSIIEAKIQEMESVFIIFSGILDNLAMAGVHSRNQAFLEKVEALIERVQEVNIVINFNSKLAAYYTEIGDATGKAHALVSSVVSIIDHEVENIVIEDLFDFFIEFSRDALDIARREQDTWYVDQIETVFSTIKLRKNLDDDDLETLQYQVLSAMNSVLSAMWNDHFGMPLLQGFSNAID
ncbi:MAG: hypothetical protein Q6353_022240 [Candidatus Sigynarchaeum springense]